MVLSDGDMEFPLSWSGLSICSNKINSGEKKSCIRFSHMRDHVSKGYCNEDCIKNRLLHFEAELNPFIYV